MLQTDPNSSQNKSEVIDSLKPYDFHCRWEATKSPIRPGPKGQNVSLKQAIKAASSDGSYHVLKNNCVCAKESILIDIK